MQGYKTQLMAAVGAIVALLAAFGLDLSEDQRAAIMAATVVWPIAMLVMRLVTKGPAKNPMTGKSVGSTARTPWWVVCMLVPLLLFGGCQSGGGQRFLDAMVESGLPEVGIVYTVMRRIEDSSDPAATAARYRAEYITPFQKAAAEGRLRAELVERLIDELIAPELDVDDPSDQYLLRRVSAIPANLAGPDQYIVGENLEWFRGLLDELEGITYLYGDAA